MATTDRSCSISPYFQVAPGKLQDFKSLCERFVTRTQTEAGVLYYGFCFDGDLVHCREAYADADGLLAHLKNVGDLLEEGLKLSQLVRLEVAGPEAELAKLRGPLGALNPKFLVLEYGFRR